MKDDNGPVMIALGGLMLILAQSFGDAGAALVTLLFELPYGARCCVLASLAWITFALVCRKLHPGKVPR